MSRSRTSTDAESVSVTSSSGSWFDVMSDPSWRGVMGLESEPESGRVAGRPPPSGHGAGASGGGGGRGGAGGSRDVRSGWAGSCTPIHVPNGESSLLCNTSTSSQEDSADMNDRLTKSLDLGHSPLQRLSSEPLDSLSTSSIDYVWDADELIDTRRYNSLPHGGVYATTTNGSLPGSPFNARKTEEPDQTDKMKNKLMAAWNNMRHGWTVRRTTNFKYDEPIWLLGKCYHNTTQEREELRLRQQRGLVAVSSIERFKRDFTSRLWFTYRQNFPALLNTQLTTDVGWGCMLRTGQMMLAQSLLMHFLGREWWWYPQQKPQDVIYHRQIVRLFVDHPLRECPYSIHRLVEIGNDMGKKPGDWYGPASVAFILREAVHQAPPDPITSRVVVYVAQDCTVYKQDVLDLCSTPGSQRNSNRSSSTSDDGAALQSPGVERPTIDDGWKAVVLLIPVRLGGEALNPVYIPCVQNILIHRMCLGVMGGKPKHSVYFIGYQEDKLIYMDPHFCQDTVDIRDRNFPVHSYHCMSPRKLPFTKMDPSCTLGFYCKTRVDFETFLSEAPQMTSPPLDQGQYPLFVISPGRGADIGFSPSTRCGSKSTGRASQDRLNKTRQSSKESDDFVFL